MDGSRLPMPHRANRNPLHGVTLEAMLHFLVERCGWEEMASQIDIRCFKFDPSVRSSLQFLRRTPWARAKVETLYIQVNSQPPQGGAALLPAQSGPKNSTS